ncbi:hypothetical protein [Polaromonas sp.]|uniref:hypothetical protein n=1 Tax=Polaromonas sp. TaxID=1869339 RepID=UPI002FC87DAB
MVFTSYFASQRGLQSIKNWAAAFARGRNGMAFHPARLALPAFRHGGFGMALALTTSNQSGVAP